MLLGNTVQPLYTNINMPYPINSLSTERACHFVGYRQRCCHNNEDYFKSFKSPQHWKSTCLILYIQHFAQSPHRISAIGWLLFMRCVSFTFTGLFLRWTPEETFEALLAKLLSVCDSATCLTKCKARHSKICEILKKTCHFEADRMPCVLF